ERACPLTRDHQSIASREAHFPATVTRSRGQIKAGAQDTMTHGPEVYTLEVRSGDTTWKYVIDKNTLFFRENSRSVSGKQVEVTRYSGFRPNTGMSVAFFKF